MRTPKIERAATTAATDPTRDVRGLHDPDWSAYEELWQLLGQLPEVAVPPRVRERVLAAAGLAMPPDSTDH
jgi:hypothetical protein